MRKPRYKGKGRKKERMRGRRTNAEYEELAKLEKRAVKAFEWAMKEIF